MGLKQNVEYLEYGNLGLDVAPNTFALHLRLSIIVFASYLYYISMDFFKLFQQLHTRKILAFCIGEVQDKIICLLIK